jgi:F0F1-type ATP synthase assembly protein I
LTPNPESEHDRAEDAPGRSGTSDQAGGAPLVGDSISLLDAFFDYLGARMRLEGYRLERHGRAMAARLVVVVAAGVVVLLGVILASIGAGGLLGDVMHSRPAGLALVGLIEIALGFLIVWWHGRKAASQRMEPGGS